MSIVNDESHIHVTLVNTLIAKNMSIAVAESCTGGLIASKITAVPGASAVFLCGVCSYSNQSKVDFLGVSTETLKAHGAVSREVALEMARGIRQRSGASIGLSTTGIAGPAGGTLEKPIGLVWIAISADGFEEASMLNLGGSGVDGEREIIRNAACYNAMKLVVESIQ